MTTFGRQGWSARFLGGMAAAVALATVGFASPASAAPHTVTVTPSTGLSDGQVVQVTGTGFTETPAVNDWSVTQCRAAVLAAPLTLQLALDNCDVFTQPFLFVHADAQGNISIPLTLRSTFSLGGGVVDCTVTPCAILVAQITSSSLGFTGAGAPISFGSSPPPPCTGADRPGHGFGDRNHCHQHRHHKSDRGHPRDEGRQHKR